MNKPETGIFHRLSWSCLLLLFAVLPLVIWTDTDDTVRTPQWVFYWTVAGAGWACLLVSGRGMPASGSPLSVPLRVYAGVAAILPFFAFRFSAALMESLGVLAGVATAALAAEWLGKPGRLRQAGVFLVTASLAVTVYGFAQYLGFDRFRWAYQYGGQRPFATLGNPNFLGGHFAVLLAWASVYFMASRQTLAKSGWFLLAVMWGMLVLVSQTRGSWLAAGASLAFVLGAGWRSSRESLQKQGPWMAGAVAVALLVAVGLSSSNSEIGSRASTLVNPQFGQLAKRAVAFKAAALMWREHPVTGIGPGCFKHGYGRFMAVAMPKQEYRQFTHSYSEEYAHSDPVQLLAETGVVGWGVFVWLAICAVRLLRRPGADPVMALSVMAGGVALLVHGSFNLPLHIAPTVFLMWVGIGLAGCGQARPVSPQAGTGRERAGRAVPAFGALAAISVGLAGALIFASSVYTRKGGDYMKFSRWAEAQWFFEKSDLVDWSDRREMFFIASMLFQRGDFRSSVSLFEKELARNPYYMDGYSNMGSALGASGDIPGAEARLRRAVELNPAYAEAYANLGVALLQQKKWLEAAGTFQQALDLEPGIEMAQRGLEQALNRGRPGKR